LIFNRPTGGDNWKSGSLEVNGKELAKIGASATGTVIMVDLGEPIAIKTIRVNIKGNANPGISSLEVYADQKR
jgi:hypothetical protein